MNETGAHGLRLACLLAMVTVLSACSEGSVSSGDTRVAVLVAVPPSGNIDSTAVVRVSSPANSTGNSQATAISAPPVATEPVRVDGEPASRPTSNSAAETARTLSDPEATASRRRHRKRARDWRPQLVSRSDSEAFAKHLRRTLEGLLDTSSPGGGIQAFPTVALEGLAVPAGDAATPAPSSESNASTTNTQETGVDEADRIEFDGRHLYIAPEPTPYFFPWFGAPVLTPVVPTEVEPWTDPGIDGDAEIALRPAPEPLPIPEPRPLAIRVMDTEGDPPQASEIGSLELPSAVRSVDGLYHVAGEPERKSDKLAVVGSSTVRPSFGQQLSIWGVPWYWQGGTSLTLFDLRDPATAAKDAHLHFDGTLVASRRIGDVVYLVTRYSVSPFRIGRPVGGVVLPGEDGIAIDTAVAVAGGVVDEEALAEARSLLVERDVNDYLPRLSIDGKERPLVDARDCMLAPGEPRADSQKFVAAPILTTITAVDLRNPREPRSVCVAGQSRFVYASLENLYLVSNTYSPEPASWIHKFGLHPRGPHFAGSASVPGFIEGSFSLGERKGALGVLSTSFDEQWFPKNRLTMLGDPVDEKGRLTVLSTLPNAERPEPLGKPREQLRGVRFAGDRVYLVTFRRVDPFYIVDISDPRDPFIEGELEIPGFSDYLHPIGDELVVGVGQHGNLSPLGVKVELFDVSDASAPASLDVVTVGLQGSRSGVDSTHLAFSILPGRGADEAHRFAIPISRFGKIELDGSSYPRWVESGLNLFEIVRSGDAGPSLEQVGAIVADARAAGEGDGNANHPFIYDWSRTNVGEDRSVIVEDDVHYIRGSSVWSAPWVDPEDAIGPQ